MKDLNNYNKIWCSIHFENLNFFNVWDYLSAKWLEILYSITNIVWLPYNEKTKEWNFIYWWWGMIRPNFIDREIYRHSCTIKWKYSIIWVWINKDISSLLEYSTDDKKAIIKWINNAEYVSVRDYGTLNFINNLYNYGKINKKINVSPCPSYHILKRKKYSNSDSKIRYSIWFVPSYWHTKWYQAYINEIIFFTKNLIKEYWEKNILILCHDFNDYTYCRNNFVHVKSLHIKTFSDISNYSLCNWIISLRGHWIIFSAALNLKCSYIYLSDKLKSLYEYHYWKSFDEKPNFSIIYHKWILEMNLLPKDLL